ncbi:MAG: NAD(P)H-hydrate dehydratase [Candidatus Roizmanbacteria bacterium]|nr:MAG: NAD(P)H-hydrate dehydratase [Candidatus Roizmanbacteria bacterium]
MQLIKTADLKSIEPFLKELYIPPADSHKGQNGKVLIIGGSELFHASSLWSAEVASHFADMVHFSSTKENNEIFLSLKKKFRNGIVINRSDLDYYIKEDDSILIGPGMMRIGETHNLTKYVIENFPNKKFVFDAGALQMMDHQWLYLLKEKPVLTPHPVEFKRLFGIHLQDLSREEKIHIVEKTAKKYNCILLVKVIVDIVSDGEKTYVIEGGNAGLTKGGTGDVLAGLCASLFAKNSALNSAVLSSYFIKKTADELFSTAGLWYRTSDIIVKLPQIFKKIVYNRTA